MDYRPRLLKLILDDHGTASKHFYDVIVTAWNGGGVPQKWKDANWNNTAQNHEDILR